MSWVERQARGRTAAEVDRATARHLRDAGVDRALDRLAGPYGLRRFVVRFERQGGGARVERIDALPLKWGGGPPADDPSGRARAEVDRALSALYRAMRPETPWERGAIGYVRDARGRVRLFPSFDEDADAARLDALPVPGPPGHPLEEPAFLDLLAYHAPRMAEVQRRTEAVADDWDLWEVRDDTRLLLHYDVDEEGRPGETIRRRCRALATFTPGTGRFAWQGRFFPERVYQERIFQVDYAAAAELCLLTAARLGASWLFVQPYDERGSLLFAAVFE